MLSSAKSRLVRPQASYTRPFAASLLALAAAFPAAAVPLYFSSSGWVQGNIDTSYSSPLLGDVRFTLQGPSDSQYNWNNPLGNTSSGLASVNYTIAAGQTSTDPIYNIVTSDGQYGFSYAAQAEADRLRLRTKTTSTTVNALGETASSPNSQLWSYASASWNQQFLIESTPHRPKGSYGAILVGFTLQGTTSDMVDGYAYGNGQLRSSFVDLAGVSFSSSFQIGTNSGDPTWTGSRTTYKKLLFQYGTVFNIDLNQWSQAYVNAESDFSHTGYISSIELPFQSMLESGAEQAGLGGTSQIYGNVTYSATADDINTNWDFSNNGGGFNPPVPEPSSYALMLAGLAAMGFLVRRRRG
ncbi:PEP-CTERM sorting domain-containing protein [Roseateles sp.]|uniref:PEP-CTERM sorting domain-containing protein n=1 Tax=Roseateles sp. TaxID=1971397 RepID=UPI00286C0053|nr:PEP-CTERM sorting domain-containing protein [Roseateles sp.]